MTLEDEAGVMNIIFWNAVSELYRKPVLGGQLLAITGMTQREGEVVHLIAKHVDDLSWMLGKLQTTSRNFH